MSTAKSNEDDKQASIRLAQRWTGQLVEIHSSGRGGGISVPRIVHNAEVVTAPSATRFHVVPIPSSKGVVAFRVSGSADLYLTTILYGDKSRQSTAEALASVPGLLADTIGRIVDFAVGRPTLQTNFEGPGFNYHPLMVQRGPPNKLQMFRLEPGIGIKSLFGTYWRSQWWNHTVSQSPHLLGDEKWRLVDTCGRRSYSDRRVLATCRGRPAVGPGRGGRGAGRGGPRGGRGVGRGRR